MNAYRYKMVPQKKEARDRTDVKVNMKNPLII